jgi:hypothetical protein
MNLIDQDIQTIEELAGLQYSWREIAVYLGVNKVKFKAVWSDPDSQLREAYDRGRLVCNTDIQIQLQKNAMAGNITAIQMYEKNRDARKAEDEKERIIYGKE